MIINPSSKVGQFSVELAEQFPYFAGIIGRQLAIFGDEWLRLFEEELDCFFGEDSDRLKEAVRGYGKFALDSMKLQVKFQKAREYENKTYVEAASEVYQNRDYMFGLYLPGILLSHYLWKHHFLQHKFFLHKFLPLLPAGGVFYDVGVGTGFYSKELLKRTSLRGEGFDLSPFALEHTDRLISAYDLEARYKLNLRDIIENPVTPPADCLVNIEVLEHLEDPLTFLKGLAGMLRPGGHGLISAAVNAPNADHIYLYRSANEVTEQLESAGFTVVDSCVENAYEPRSAEEIVPINAGFIVTR